MAKLSKAHRALLDPYGQAFARMNEKIFDMPDADLQALNDAVNAVDEGNVWCMIYDAAQWLRAQINDELLRRKDRDTTLKTAEGKQE